MSNEVESDILCYFVQWFLNKIIWRWWCCQCDGSQQPLCLNDPVWIRIPQFLWQTICPLSSIYLHGKTSSTIFPGEAYLIIFLTHKKRENNGRGFICKTNALSSVIWGHKSDVLNYYSLNINFLYFFVVDNRDLSKFTCQICRDFMF